MLIYDNNIKEFSLRSIDKINRYSSINFNLKSLAHSIYAYKINHKEIKGSLSASRTLDNIVIYYHPLKYKDQFDIRIRYIYVVPFSWTEGKRRIVTYRKRAAIASEKRSQKISIHYKYMTLFLGWERKFKMYEYTFIIRR